MKRKKITIDKEEIFESLREVGITLEKGNCPDGMEVTDETGRTIILHENFSFFDDLPYSFEKDEDSSQNVHMIVCVNIESMNEYKNMNEYKKKVHREESKSMNISNDMESIIDCLAA